MGYVLVCCYFEDMYVGNCFYYGDCLEGIVVGLVVEGCFGKKGYLLEEDYKIWELEVYYLV